MRQINFLLWVGALVTTWHDPSHIPVGHQWIPFAGIVVSLFWPGKSKSKALAAAANSPAGEAEKV